MKTVHVMESLSAYLDGYVGADERTRIAAHLEACDACRTHLASMRKTVTLLHGAEPVRAPDGFRAHVRARIETRESRRAIRWPWWAWSWRMAGAVAAVVLIGLFTVNLMRDRAPTFSVLTERDASKAPQAPTGVNAVPPGAGPMNRSSRATGLGGGQEGAPSISGAPGLVGPAGGPSLRGAPVLPGLRRVIRTASVSLEVSNLDETAARLTQIAEAAGGFVADSSTTHAGSVPEGMFVVRVPAPRFADVLSQVDGLGRIQQRRLSGQDVTEESIDLQSRIRNLERYEQRLLTFVDRAAKVSDVLAIEQELARVRGEIEMLTGRARYLDRQVDLATIQVSAHEKTKQSSSFWDVDETLARIRSAFLATIRQIVRATEAIIVALSALVPVLVLAGLGWVVVRRMRATREA
jgi:hypothetical protein